MKILILGISGRTGHLTAEEAIKRRHNVVGIARNPELVALNDINIFKGTPYDLATVRMAITGCDAVISTISLFSRSQGMFGKISTPLDILSVSMKNTVSAMEEHGIKRIVLMTALGVGDSAKQLPGVARWLINQTNIRYSYADHELEEEVLENTNLDWTIVRPAGLNNRNENVSTLYKLNGTGKIKNTISRNAVAHFMMDCLEKGEFIRQKPGISNE